MSDRMHSIRTKKMYAESGSSFQRWCALRGVDWTNPPAESIEQLADEMQGRGLLPRTVLNNLAAIKDLLGSTGRSQPFDDHAVVSLRRRLWRAARSDQRTRKPLRRNDLERAFAYPPVSLANFRDRSFTILGYGSGGYSQREITNIRVQDVRIDRIEMTIVGISGIRVIPRGITDLCPVKAVESWMEVRGESSGPLFCILQGKNMGGRLTKQNVFDILRQVALRAGVNPSGICYASLRAGAQLDRNETRALGL